MAMNSNAVPSDGPPEDELLPCGRRLEEVWEADDTGDAESDPHLQDCTYCSAALRELNDLHQVVRQARRTEQDEPVSEDFTDRVMGRIRRHSQPEFSVSLLDYDSDPWTLEAVAARRFRAAADSLPGVAAGSCQVRPLTEGALEVTGPVEVRLEVSASLGMNFHSIADAIRTRVMAAADERLGMEVQRVDVTVTDILEEKSDA
ncbi:Asp23/Gls24 family envelope stress response protein [Streptomyces sp. NPDC058045]|uniref:Asp23/Gls24 family envelope stress response protein n=1 Tax=Streptomyces sp. NPDC058045 TaxID=3346311 RepID=UPI0036EDD509